jgi:hypothetical protein
MRWNRHVLDSQSAHHLASGRQQHNRGITYRKVWSAVLLNTTRSHFVTTVINSPRLIHRCCFFWSNRYLDHRLEMQQQQQPSLAFLPLIGRCWFATKAKKVGKQPKEIVTPTPVMTDAMQVELETLNRRFERLELEPYGPTRGITTTLQLIKEEKLEARITKRVANLYLNNWIYKRYALRLEYPLLTQVPSDVVANTLIREGTTIRFFRYKNPKTILKELFRYGESVMQQRYFKKDADSLKPPKPVENPLTPEEEEYERRAWDRKLFAPKPFGHKRKRLGKWRK